MDRYPVTERTSILPVNDQRPIRKFFRMGHFFCAAKRVVVLSERGEPKDLRSRGSGSGGRTPGSFESLRSRWLQIRRSGPPDGRPLRVHQGAWASIVGRGYIPADPVGLPTCFVRSYTVPPGRLSAGIYSRPTGSAGIGVTPNGLVQIRFANLYGADAVEPASGISPPG